MSDRYSTVTREVPVERERNTVFVPGGAPSGSSSVEPRGKTWGIRRRGDTEGTVVHAYRCPVHGLVDVRVPRSHVPDDVPCPEVDNVGHYCSDPPCLDCDRGGVQECVETATWAGSQCGQGWAAGECKS